MLRLTNIFIGILLLISACQTKKTENPLLTPTLRKALADFEIAEDFEIELFAAEPLVADPVAMEIDENGNHYVVEMHGYPLNKNQTGQVKLLIDSNQDGFPDKNTVFADSLVLPTGIMRWKKGILVTDPPHVWYFEDRNEDGKADLKQKILTGFALSNPQHNLNNPVLGLDNWIYLAHESSITPALYKAEFSDEGTEIYFPDKPEIKIAKNANGRNVRFNPDTHKLEICAGETQYGQTFDEYGHHFLNSNAHHIFQEVIQAHYLQRNPSLLVADATQNLPDHGNACKVFPITQNPQHLLLTDVGVMTSACGITYYSGGIFPEKYQNMTLVAEPVHNLVHADFLEAKGASFTAKRVFENKEFLASKDPKFRPVNFYVGPDGAVYLLDYYRPIIEHPEWMADDLRKSNRLYEDNDKGRIYKIKPKNVNLEKFKPLSKLGAAELVELLKHKNSWYRRNAQRMLLDKKDLSVVPALQKMIQTDESPQSVVHALWTLEGLGKIDLKSLQISLQHKIAGVRENALKISELYLDKLNNLDSEILKLKDDSSARVRFQLLCTLGSIETESAKVARNQLLIRDIEDKWVHYAALSAQNFKPMEIYDFALKNLAQKPTEGRALFFANLGALIGLSQDEQIIKKLLQNLQKQTKSENYWTSTATLEGLSKTLAMSEKPLNNALADEKKSLMSLLFVDKNGQLGKAVLGLLDIIGLPDENSLAPYLQKSLTILKDSTTEVASRCEALSFLAAYDAKKYLPDIQPFTQAQQPIELQKTAILAFRKVKGLEACAYLIKQWDNFSPEIRLEAVEVFMQDKPRKLLLLSALEKKQIPPTAIQWPNQVRLMNTDEMDIRDRSRVIFATQTTDKAAILSKYKSVATLQGDAHKGQALYQSLCAVCHQVGGKAGKNIGPDLATLGNRDDLSIALEIALPSNSLADGYEYWTIEKTDGQKTFGLISSETANALTVKDLSGKESTIARIQIKRLTASNTSIMPAGFDKSLNPQQMADLIKFIRE